MLYSKFYFLSTDITYGEFAQLLPLALTVDAYELTGQELWNSFEHIFKSIDVIEPLKVTHFLQVSGLKYTVNLSKNTGKRIVSIEVLENEADGEK